MGMLLGYFLLLLLIPTSLWAYAYFRIKNPATYRVGILLGGITMLIAMPIYLMQGLPLLPDLPRNIILTPADGNRVSALPAIDAQTMQDAAALSPEEQAQMIQQMVTGLAEKLQDDPTDIAGWRRLARAYQVLGEQDKQIDALKQIYRQTPDDEVSAILLSRAIRTKYDGFETAESLKILQDLLAKDPNHQEALLFLGVHYWRNNEKNKAEQYFKTLFADIPKDSDYYKELEKYIDKVIE